MTQERILILKMVSEGKLTPEEGERLIAALEGGGGANGQAGRINAIQNLLSQASRDVQKGLKKAGEILRNRQRDLRKHIENLTRKKGDAGTNAHRTITIEVEEEGADHDSK